MSSTTAPEIWFLTGSQTLYGPEVLEQVEAQSRVVVETLAASGAIPARIVHRPVLAGADAIRAACVEASADDACIGVIAWMHTFSPAKAWIGGLTALRKPLLHLHTQAARELPWSTIDMDYMNLNQAAHGDREFGFIETRLRLDRATVSGHASDPVVSERIGAWARAAIGWQESQHLKVARFGDNMRDVAVTEGDKVEAQIQLGVSVNTYGVTELVDAVDATSDAAVSDLVTTYEDLYDMAADLRRGGERHESVRYAARIEIGLRSLLEEGGFGAFTTNFEDLGGLRQLPGVAVQRLMADGYGFGAEGDWKSAVLGRIVKSMGTGLPGGTSFMEDYTYHLGPGTPRVLGAHMLEVCPSIAAGRPRLEVHPLSIGGREDPARLVFSAEPGPAVVIGMVDLGDRFRLVANEIDVVPPDSPLLRLPVAHAVWEPRPSFDVATEGWLYAGGPHHTVLTSAVSTQTLRHFAETAGIELVLIGHGSTIDAVRDRLRWDSAYYRLRQGL
jgi:L-arabinose isomerase